MQQQNYELSLLITALATVRAQRGPGAAGKRLAGSRGDAGTQRGEQGAELPPLLSRCVRSELDFKTSHLFRSISAKRKAPASN